MNVHVREPMSYELNKAELRMAISCGVQRNIQNILRGAGPGDGCDGWTRHIEGAAGEIVVAKHLNIFWNGNIGDRDARDVGGYEVKTASKDHYRLGIRAKDADDRAYILVIGQIPRFRIIGWLYGRDIKKPEYWDEDPSHRPGWYAPQSALHPMSTLPKL